MAQQKQKGTLAKGDCSFLLEGGEVEDKQKLEKALMKKAVGFVHDEIIEEYICGEDGEKLCKKKVTKKFVPPDIPAMKLLLEVFDKQVPLTEMSEQELQQEKKRLLLELEKLKGETDGD